MEAIWKSKEYQNCVCHQGTWSYLCTAIDWKSLLVIGLITGSDCSDYEKTNTWKCNGRLNQWNSLRSVIYLKISWERAKFSFWSLISLTFISKRTKLSLVKIIRSWFDIWYSIISGWINYASTSWRNNLRI